MITQARKAHGRAFDIPARVLQIVVHILETPHSAALSIADHGAGIAISVDAGDFAAHHVPHIGTGAVATAFFESVTGGAATRDTGAGGHVGVREQHAEINRAVFFLFRGDRRCDIQIDRNGEIFRRMDVEKPVAQLHQAHDQQADTDDGPSQLVEKQIAHQRPL